MVWMTVSVMNQSRELVRLAMFDGVNQHKLFRCFRVSAETGYNGWRAQRPTRGLDQLSFILKLRLTPWHLF
jgi:hypothetical protein